MRLRERVCQGRDSWSTMLLVACVHATAIEAQLDAPVSWPFPQVSLAFLSIPFARRPVLLPLEPRRRRVSSLRSRPLARPLAYRFEPAPRQAPERGAT